MAITYKCSAKAKRAVRLVGIMGDYVVFMDGSCEAGARIRVSSVSDGNALVRALRDMHDNHLVAFNILAMAV